MAAWCLSIDRLVPASSIAPAPPWPPWPTGTERPPGHVECSPAVAAAPCSPNGSTPGHCPRATADEGAEGARCHGN
eukprot:11159651-Lingulodinium_polyedra.AAC.1